MHDIERLRDYLDIDRWLLFGGSWGSTLALAYAQAHPLHVTALVLRGVFLGRRSEVDWFLHGLRAIFPDAHAAFAGHLPPEERHDLLANYLKRLTEPDAQTHMAAARAWSVYEGSCKHAAAEPRHGEQLRPGPQRPGPGPHRSVLFRPQPVFAARGVYWAT